MHETIMNGWRSLKVFVFGALPSGGAFNATWPRMPAGHVPDPFGVGAGKLRHG